MLFRSVVAICPDTSNEADETFTITISSPTQAILGATTTASGTITNDDFPNVSIAVDTASIAEATATATITATLSYASAQNVTVNLQDSGGTATLTNDYTRSGLSITIPAGSLTGSVTVTSAQDALDEDDETVVIAILNASKATVSGSSVTITILDDDGAPTVTLSGGGQINTEAGGTATVTDRKSTRLNSSHTDISRMPSSA